MITEYEIIINQLSQKEGEEMKRTEFFKQRVKAINLPAIFGAINHLQNREESEILRSDVLRRTL